MALQTSGQISLNDIHVEAGGFSGSSCSINDTDIRGLIGKSSGSAMDFADWYGASGEDEEAEEGCFTGDMIVTMADGTETAIKAMQIGDNVLASGGTTAEVLNLHIHENKTLDIFTINEQLQTTNAHPIWADGGWKAIDPDAAQVIHPELSIQQLEVGMYLLDKDGYSVQITSITETTEQTTVYNLDVSGDNTYFVEGFLVHNK